jgi:hypothetical protein
MPDAASNEVVVIVPDDTGISTATLIEPEPVVVEIFDAILDPVGSNDPTDQTSIATGAGEPEYAVLEAGADSPGTESGSATTSSGVTDALGVAEPIAVSPDVEGGSPMPDITDATDSQVTETGSDDTVSGVAASDPDVTAADPDTTTTDSTTDTTDPDNQSQTEAVSDAQQTLDQAEQAEGKAAASGDYATAQDDALQAYAASQDVANAGGPDSTDETWAASQSESWANWDQQTADENAQAAQSYAESGNMDDAGIYAAAADNAQGNADASGEAGEYGDPLGPQDNSTAVAEEAPVEDSAPVDESASVDTTAAADDSSATGD